MIHLCGLVMLAELHLERGQSTIKRKRRLVSLLKCVLQQQQFIQFVKLIIEDIVLPSISRAICINNCKVQGSKVRKKRK